MIRIRYKDLSAGTHECTGLHGRAESDARGVTVYLVPGLTAGERRAVFRRLRQEASRGFGPLLPQPQLAVALGLDRVRTAARTTAAAVRLHPAVTLLPGACVAAATAFFVVTAAAGPAVPGGPRSELAATVPLGPAPAASVAARPASAGPSAARVWARSAGTTDATGATLFTVGRAGGR